MRRPRRRLLHLVGLGVLVSSAGMMGYAVATDRSGYDVPARYAATSRHKATTAAVDPLYGEQRVQAELDRFKVMQLEAAKNKTDLCEAAKVLAADFQKAVDERLSQIDQTPLQKPEHKEALIYGAMQRALSGERMLVQGRCVEGVAGAG